MRWILCLLLLVSVAFADEKPQGCSCDPPMIEGCTIVTPGGPTECDKKLDACLDWCLEHTK